MALPEVVSKQLPKALAATIVLITLNSLTGDISALVPLLTDFVVYLIAFFIGFVFIEASGTTWSENEA